MVRADHDIQPVPRRLDLRDKGEPFARLLEGGLEFLGDPGRPVDLARRGPPVGRPHLDDPFVIPAADPVAPVALLFYPDDLRAALARDLDPVEQAADLRGDGRPVRARLPEGELRLRAPDVRVEVERRIRQLLEQGRPIDGMSLQVFSRLRGVAAEQ